ncbi:MAG: hypothetical protein JRG69_12815 [Deltaproteobacteria bacterium]|nr:hypothetical protein [Deltaproteobacteria bacterium]
MPSKTNPQDILDKILWVRTLPDGGGSWGMGLTGTAEAVAREISDLKKTRESLDEQIRKRLRVMRAIPGRAEREAPLMYEDEAIKEAHSDAMTKAPELD